MKKIFYLFAAIAGLTMVVFSNSCRRPIQDEVSGVPIQKVANTSTIPVVADWETGNTSQWNTIVAPTPTVQFEVGTSATVPVRQGTYAARFTVRPNDSLPGLTGERCEADMSRAGKNNYVLETDNDEYYYGWSTYFPTTWTNPKNFGIFMQFHHTNHCNPPIAFNAHNDSIGVLMYTGHVTQNSSGTFSFAYKKYHIIQHTIVKGWQDFIVRVKFRPDWTGIVQVWHRLAGQPEFSQLLDLDSIPTMQWFDDGSLIYKDTVMHGSWFTSKVWLRNGFYRDKGGSNVNTIIHDNFARADNYATIRARF